MAEKGREGVGPADGARGMSSRFDEAAATWDENPHRRRVTERIAGAIREDVPLKRGWRVLEYGCGTATLGFLLAPRVGEVVAADASPGMIEQVGRKLAGAPGVKLKPLLLDLGREPAPAGRFDLIVTAMAMHHVEDTGLVLGRLAEMLAEGGWLAVADLCAEDGSFHEDVVVPHNGFEPEALAGMLRAASPGMETGWRVVHTVVKNGRGYDMFLLTGRRAG